MEKETTRIITDRAILLQISVKTTVEEVERLDLVKKMREAILSSWVRGSGLAAIQIGIPLRFGWFEIEGKEGILLNPVIIAKYGISITREGCLSIPKVWIEKERAYEIEYLTLVILIPSNGKKKKARGFKARLIQHEIDHMNGILMTDKENKNERNKIQGLGYKI